MGSNIQVLMSNIQLQINQEIYFLDTSTLEVFETYEINNKKTAQKLGVFKINILCVPMIPQQLAAGPA
jgi:hypothetical protein